MKEREVNVTTTTQKEGDRVMITTKRVSNISISEAEKELKALTSAMGRYEDEIKKVEKELSLISKSDVSKEILEEHKRILAEINNLDKMNSLDTNLDNLKSEYIRVQKTAAELEGLLL